MLQEKTYDDFKFRLNFLLHKTYYMFTKLKRSFTGGWSFTIALTLLEKRNKSGTLMAKNYNAEVI